VIADLAEAVEPFLFQTMVEIAGDGTVRVQERQYCFRERDPVLSLVLLVLGLIPVELSRHPGSLTRIWSTSHMKIWHKRHKMNRGKPAPCGGLREWLNY
jgi:hypothetical protein